MKRPWSPSRTDEPSRQRPPDALDWIVGSGRVEAVLGAIEVGLRRRQRRRRAALLGVAAGLSITASLALRPHR